MKTVGPLVRIYSATSACSSYLATSLVLVGFACLRAVESSPFSHVSPLDPPPRRHAVAQHPHECHRATQPHVDGAGAPGCLTCINVGKSVLISKYYKTPNIVESTNAGKTSGARPGGWCWPCYGMASQRDRPSQPTNPFTNQPTNLPTCGPSVDPLTNALAIIFSNTIIT